MIRQVDSGALFRGVDDVLATDPEDELEPVANPLDLDDDPYGLTVQRARFNRDGKAIDTPGKLIVDIDIPYTQLPSVGIVPEDNVGSDVNFELPPGTTPELAHEGENPTLLEDLGFEHKQVSDQLIEALRRVPVVEETSVAKPFCVCFTGESAAFATEGILTESINPRKPVPEDQRLPGQFRANT